MSRRIRMVLVTLSAVSAAALGGSGWGPFWPGGWGPF
jgi:hypothetical protein